MLVSQQQFLGNKNAGTGEKCEVLLQQFVSNLPFQVLFVAAAWEGGGNFQYDNEPQCFFDVGVFVFSQQAALSTTTPKHRILLKDNLPQQLQRFIGALDGLSVRGILSTH